MTDLTPARLDQLQALVEDETTDVYVELETATLVDLIDAARDTITLRAWKTDALTVLAGLDELGQALELPLGEQITGPRALGAVNALRESRDAAQRMAAALAGGSDTDG